MSADLVIGLSFNRTQIKLKNFNYKHLPPQVFLLYKKTTPTANAVSAVKIFGVGKTATENLFCKNPPPISEKDGY